MLKKSKPEKSHAMEKNYMEKPAGRERGMTQLYEESHGDLPARACVESSDEILPKTYVFPT
jgi:hypothetical protein